MKFLHSIIFSHEQILISILPHCLVQYKACRQIDFRIIINSKLIWLGGLGIRIDGIITPNSIELTIA